MGPSVCQAGVLSSNCDLFLEETPKSLGSATWLALGFGNQFRFLADMTTQNPLFRRSLHLNTRFKEWAGAGAAFILCFVGFPKES